MSPPLRLRRVRNELGLADRRELGRPVGPVGGAALDEHRPLDAVAGAGVGQQFARRRTGADRPSGHKW